MRGLLHKIGYIWHYGLQAMASRATKLYDYLVLLVALLAMVVALQCLNLPDF
jgi:hypothetical protein